MRFTTNGGAHNTFPADVPDGSDIVLVTTYGHDAAGRVDRTTDLKGIVSRTGYDLLGRPPRVVEAAGRRQEPFYEELLTRFLAAFLSVSCDHRHFYARRTRPPRFQ